MDSVYRIRYTFANSGRAIQFRFAGTNLQEPDERGPDESWGITNVQVAVGVAPAVPAAAAVPPTPAPKPRNSPRSAPRDIRPARPEASHARRRPSLETGSETQTCADRQPDSQQEGRPETMSRTQRICLSVVMLPIFLAVLSSPAHAQAIIDAVKRNDLPAVRGLIRSDPRNVSATDRDGATPLHWAANVGNLEMIRLLIQSGAAVNIRQANGWAPIHSAAVGEPRRSHPGTVAAGRRH